MGKLTRKELLKGGVAGAAAVAALPFTSSLVFADEGAVAVHVHARVFSGSLGVDINVDAAGRSDALSGAGWDSFNFDSADQSGACYFSQRGKLEGDEIHLHGRVFFSNTAGFVGAHVTTSADLESGAVTWTFESTPTGLLTFTTSAGVATKID